VPELPEVENYRRLAELALERTVRSVSAPDAWYLKRGLSAGVVSEVLAGRRFLAARRRGKLLMLDTSDEGPVVGLRFGMSGRLVVDGSVGVDRLLYGSAAVDARFDRFTVCFEDGGSLVMSDPRRLGGVELDPDESRLGPDAVGISPAELKRALAGSRAPLKARLLDQAHMAGVGNLIADEVLWRAGLSPLRPAGDLPAAALRRLHRGLSEGLALLIERGGAHTGDLMPERRRGGHCPRDGAELARGTVGGRTTYWCPRHQK
jgi:formamidopyrimidine-DNA glycosylase